MSVLLKALNLLDAALAPRAGRLVARDVAFGAEPRQRLDIYAPRGGGADRPVLVFFYGGNWDSGDKHDYAFVGRAFGALGYVTVLPDYHHTHERPWPAFMADAGAALAWAAANIGAHGGDPARITVAGHSAGAYIAVMLALDPRWEAADQIMAGIGIAGPYDFLPLDTPVTLRTFGHADDLAATQPVNFVSAAAPPLLLLTGEADKTVLPRHSRTLAARLTAAGAEVELITYPGIDHTGPVKAISRLFRGHAPVLGNIAAFLRRQGLG